MTSESKRQGSHVTLRHHNGQQAREIADELAATYREAYVDTPQEHEPFYSAGRFIERFHGYTSAPGFELITAHDDDQLAGYVFGYALPPGARWWNGLLDTVPEGFTRETGTRTFALNELHVRRSWRGHGIASLLHDELISHRHEERATILVRPENPARAKYLHWGYQIVGRLQPYPDSPVYDALVLDLRQRQKRLAGRPPAQETGPRL